MTLREFLEAFEFGYTTEVRGNRTVYKLFDYLGVNLGGINQEKFDSIEDIVDRLGIYYHDYIFTELEEEFGYDGEEYYPDILKWLESYPEDGDKYVSILYMKKIVECIVNPELIKEWGEKDMVIRKKTSPAVGLI